MSDNLKKKGADSKRFAITQKHERDYMLRSTKRLLKLFEDDTVYAKTEKEKPYVMLFSKGGFEKDIGTKPIIRCLKVLIGILEKYKRK